MVSHRCWKMNHRHRIALKIDHRWSLSHNHNLFSKSTHNLDKLFKIYCPGRVDVNLEKVILKCWVNFIYLGFWVLLLHWILSRCLCGNPAALETAKRMKIYKYCVKWKRHQRWWFFPDWPLTLVIFQWFSQKEGVIVNYGF